jgi:hypothetical protein
MRKLWTVVFMISLSSSVSAQSARDTVRYLYSKSRVDTATFMFVGNESLIRYEKNVKNIKKHLDTPINLNDRKFYLRKHLSTGEVVGLFYENHSVAIFSRDTIFAGSGSKFHVIQYSHLKWVYKQGKDDVLICRFFTENKVMNVILEFIGSPADRELLTLVALEKARNMIYKNQWTNPNTQYSPFVSPMPPPYIR